MDEEVLATVLTEVEAILNSRPLCAASDDSDDQEPLTPNHLLLQKAVHNLPPGSFVKEERNRAVSYTHLTLPTKA